MKVYYFLFYVIVLYAHVVTNNIIIKIKKGIKYLYRNMFILCTLPTLKIQLEYTQLKNIHCNDWLCVNAVLIFLIEHSFGYQQDRTKKKINSQ